MNILFTFPFMFHPLKGGTERITDSVAKGLKEYGHDIYYLNFKRNELYFDYEYPAKQYFFDESFAQTDSGIEWYKDFLKKNKIDVVINQGGIMGSCKVFSEVEGTGTKCITCIHVDPFFNSKVLFNELSTLRDLTFLEQLKRVLRMCDYLRRRRKLNNYLKDLYSFWNCKSDKIVLLSNSFLPNLQSFVKDLDTAKVCAIPNANTYSVNTDPTRKRTKTILFVGRMDMGAKKPTRMIEIWRRINRRFPDWELVMVGDGKFLDYLKKKASDLPRVSFTGYSDPLPFYQRAEILCMTSSYEGWGLVLTEAMCNGAVPLAFNSYAALGDILTEEIQKIEPFDIDQYCDKLSIIMSDIHLREELRFKGYAHVAKFDAKIIGEMWNKLVNEVIQS